MKSSVTYTMKEGNPYNFDDLGSLFAFTKRALISLAVDALEEEQALGFDKSPVVVVDNKRGESINKVKPLGKIQFVARQDLKDILIFAYNSIMIRSKELSGDYKRSNVVTFNGQQVANTEEGFTTWLNSIAYFEPRDRIRFVNTSPYARKLERYGISKGVGGLGRSSRRYRKADKHEKRKGGTQFLVPNGTYALAQRAIARKYQANAFIKFEFLPGDSLGITGPGTQYKRGASAGKSYLFPTILIYATPSGLRNI